jgi:hypothetical protein
LLPSIDTVTADENFAYHAGAPVLVPVVVVVVVVVAADGVVGDEHARASNTAETGNPSRLRMSNLLPRRYGPNLA